MSPTRLTLLVFWSITFLVFICKGYERSFLFARYGPVAYGRPVTKGKYQGSRSRLGCLELCTHVDYCKAFRHSVADENGESSCYTFTSYTHSRKMVPMLQTSYYEKRNCEDLLDVTAAVYFEDVHRMFLFSGSHVRVIRVLTVGYQFLFNRFYDGPVSGMFPGFVSRVDGATEYYGNNTMLISGASVSCYSRNGETFTAVSCPADLISEYFNESGFSNIGAVASIDLSFRDLHIFRNDVTYHLWYDEAMGRYVYNGSTPMTDGSSQWSAAPFDLTAALHFEDGLYLMFELHKFYFYYTTPIKRVSRIINWCF